MKERPGLFEGVRSHKAFRHLLGGNYGGCVEMTTLESLADVEKFTAGLMADKEFMTRVFAKYMAVMVTETYSVNIWSLRRETRGFPLDLSS
jgi:hypothetical protein